MSRRAAVVTQADLVRAIRAAKQAGLEVHRVIVRGDGVSIEAKDSGDTIVTLVPDPEMEDIGL